MKKIITFFAFVAVLFATFSCNKDVKTIEEPSSDDCIIEFATGPVTKTVFGTLDGTTYPTLWTTEKKVAISLNYATAKESSTPVLASGGATASFTAAITDDEAAEKKLLAVSPFTSIVGTTSFNSNYKSIKFIIESNQTPLANSVDEDDQVLAAFENAGASLPSSTTLNFSHVAAYGRMSFANLTLAAGESIESVSMTSTLDWAGQFYYYFEDNTHGNNAGDITVANGEKTINLTTTSDTDIWFACAPVAIGGTTVHVVITTDKGTTYSKDVAFPAGKQFQSGHVAKFTIDMDGISADGAKVYSLVTNLNELTDGSKVLVVAKHFDYAIGAQNTNYRAQAGITKNGDDINSPSASVTEFTIGSGYNNNFYSIKSGDNYLNAPGGGNYLSETDALDANSTWKITLGADNVASIVSTNPTASQKVLSYNENNTRFSCYAAIQKKNETSEYGYLTLYKLDGSGDASKIITYIDMASSKALETGSAASSLGAVTNSSATITYGTSNGSVATVDEDGNVTATGVGSCTITASVVANGNYLATSATCTITVTAPQVWKLTALGDIEDTDVFVIVGTNDDGSYALPHSNGTSSAPSVVEVTTTTDVSGTKLSGAVADGIKWNLSGDNTNGYIFYPNGSTTTWLFITNTNNGVRVGNQTSTTSNKTTYTNIQKFKLDGSSHLQNVGISTRYLSIYENNGTPTDWRCYANTNSAPAITFYVLQ